MPQVKLLLKNQGHLVIPLLVLIFFLFVLKSSPAMAAFWSIIATPIACWLRPSTRMSWHSIVKALERGAQLTLIAAAATATAGIVIGVINLTGLGLRFSSLLVGLAGGNLLLLLILTMLSSLILGMGLPPVAAYIVLAVLAAPAITNLGISPMAAHLFIFFYGIIGAVTPPVAMAAYAAAGLAKADPTRTGLIAFRLAMVAFIIPFQFVYGPSLIMEGDIVSIVTSSVSAITGVAALAIALERYLKGPIHLVSRLLLGVGALLLTHVGLLTDVIGYPLVALVIWWEWRSNTPIKGPVPQESNTAS